MPTRTYTYTIHLEPAEEGGYVVTIPTLGCATQGETYDEAIAMAQDCIEGWLAMLGVRKGSETYSSILTGPAAAGSLLVHAAQAAMLPRGTCLSRDEPRDGASAHL
jgi:predicted RNase H-like HicB family nuclease